MTKRSDSINSRGRLPVRHMQACACHRKHGRRKRDLHARRNDYEKDVSGHE